MRAAFRLLQVVFGVVVVMVIGAGYAVWRSMGEQIWETRTPVSREEAGAHCPISLPVSAHNVQYAWVVGGFQNTAQYVRFEAPVADCFTQAQQIYADYARNDPRFQIPKFLATARATRPPTHSDLNVGWFDVDAMPEGVVAGAADSGNNTPQIWIDTSRGVFYFYLTD